jgi:hypothetical protein
LQTSSDSSWELCNHTELYQLCRRVGLSPLPSYSREQLIALLEGTEEEERVWHPVDSYRDAIKCFIDDFRPKLQSQLTCPAKDPMDPRPCFKCVDAQVFAFLVNNETCEPHILNRRKRTS